MVKGNVADFANGGFDQNNMHNIIIVDFNNDEKYYKYKIKLLKFNFI